jgi:flagellar protein FliS
MKIANAASAYWEAASVGASPVGVIVLLYDGLVQDIHHAAVAMKNNNVEGRTLHINRALLILQQLQGRLDFAAGGAAARQLDNFYSTIRGKLLEAQIRQSPEMLLAEAQAVAQVREGWAEVERATSSASASAQPNAPTASQPEPPALNLGT